MPDSPVTTTATIKADIVFSQQQTYAYSSSNIVLQGSTDYSTSLVSGSGSEVRQIDSIYNIGGVTIASGATGVYDLRNLKQDVFGSQYTLSLTGIKGLIITNQATGINEMLLVKATGTNAFTNIFHGGSGGPEGVKIGPGGAYFYSDPYAGTPVTATNSVLNLINAGSGSGPENYNEGIAVSIIIAGTSGTGGY
tara:strand:+ start:5614 stop:6195 length:582 start_codon:yes stop_codon:yes gene_type:complete